METTWKVVKKLLEPFITPAILPVHPVTQLQELCQSKGIKVKMRDLWRETGEIEFAVEGEFLGRAKYTAKRAVAKNRAALIAYRNLVEKLRLHNTTS